MKKLSYIFICASILILTSCNGENLPFANWFCDEISELTAVAGDSQVTLTWAPDADTPAEGYCIIYNPNGDTIFVESEVLNHTITGLTNGTKYTFSVQADYGKTGRSGQVSVNCTPVTSRFPVTDLIAAAGNNAIKATWKKPVAENVAGYTITLMPGNIVVDINNPDILSKIISGLTNDVEYTVSVRAKYTNGNSEAVTSTVTPGNVQPITSTKTHAMLNEAISFLYNDLFFTKDIASVSWNFGDGSVTTTTAPSHTYTKAGKYNVSMTANYTDGTSSTGNIDLYIIGYKWQYLFNEHLSSLSSSFGMVKASSPAYASDGTIYIILCGNGSAGQLFAINPDGTTKWVFEGTTGNSYGTGPAVGNDGTIYFGNSDKNFYAVKPDGTLKWKYTTGGAIACFPAIASDGSAYVISGDNVLYALSSTGSLKWSVTLDNTAGAIVIGNNGNIYAGTKGSIYCFDNTGAQLWQTVASCTEKCSFAMNGGMIYAAQKGGSGLMAISMSSGSIAWSFPISNGGDAYTPVVGKDGTIYFGCKSGLKFYAITSSGSEKWSYTTGCALNYCSPVIDSNNVVYFGSQADSNNESGIWAINGSDGSLVWKMSRTSNGKIMAGAAISPAGILHIGTLGVSGEPGALIAIDIFAGLETSSWSVRGGNYFANSRQ